MHHLRLLGSDDPIPAAAVPHLHGLYTSPAPGDCCRAVIAHEGRVLLDATYHPTDLTDADLRELYVVVTERRRRTG